MAYADLARRREYYKEYARRYRQRPTRKHQEWARQIRKKFGLSVEGYQALFEAQRGVCKICHTPPTTIRLHIDHCHMTGRIRGLLCRKCNRALGLFADKADWLRAAIQYLEG